VDLGVALLRLGDLGCTELGKHGEGSSAARASDRSRSRYDRADAGPELSGVPSARLRAPNGAPRGVPRLLNERLFPTSAEGGRPVPILR
jgi:hypothetical protein